jgi:hypothetical protein
MSPCRRSAGLVVLGSVVLTLAGACAAQAGWHAPQKVDATRRVDGPIAVATAPSGHAVAVWESRSGLLRVAVARPGRPFGRSREIPGSQLNGIDDDVRVAVAPNGRAIVALEYLDGTVGEEVELRSEGCCRGTKVAIVSPGGGVTGARAVRPRGTVSPLSGIAAGASRFGVLIGGSFATGVRFVAVSASGRPGSPRTVATKGLYDGASLQFSGRRAVAGLVSTFPARVAVSAQRASGAFAASKVVVRVAQSGRDGFLINHAMTPDGHGRNVIAYSSGAQPTARVTVVRADAAGHVTTLARPTKALSQIALGAPAASGGAFALGYGQGSTLRLITRSASGRLRRRALVRLGDAAGLPVTATGGGSIAISTSPSSRRFGASLAPRVLYVRAAGGRPSQISLPVRSFGPHPVAVDGRGRVRVLYRDADGRVSARLRTR